MTYQRGSLGGEVALIQRRRAELGFYHGPLDRVFGGGTESAVCAFQRAGRPQVDGRVGAETWARLFPAAAIPTPALACASLEHRCLALTGSFETDAPPPDCFADLSGDFDGHGLSFGVLQWNLGRGSLQPLLQRLDARRPGLLDDVFNAHAATLRAVLAAPREEQLAWARGIQVPRHSIHEPWRGLFKTLGRRPECQLVQTQAAESVLAETRKLVAAYGLSSERALALMFDIKVQNGGISTRCRAKTLAGFAGLPADLPLEKREPQRMRIVAERRAAVAKLKWRPDVLARKLTIADGVGEVHGRMYDLGGQFGLHLGPRQ